MTPPLLQPIAVCLSHERRRRAQPPRLADLQVPEREALEIVRREEMRRAAERAGEMQA